MVIDKEAQSGALRHMRGYCPETKTWVSIRVNDVGEIVIDPITPDKINNPSKARAYLGTDQLNLTSGDFTKVLLDTENYDIGEGFDVDNNKYVAPLDGYYQISSTITWNSVVANKLYYLAIYKNGTVIAYSRTHSSLAIRLSNFMSDIVYLEADDEI
ncbi:unnamed protein product, partial [marine sediment metagenome]